MIGCEAANRLAADADVVLAVGTRLQDFTTGSWSIFRNPAMRLIGVNAARFDAGKHLALPVVGDARESLAELDEALGDWTAPAPWTDRVAGEVAGYWAYLDKLAAVSDGPAALPTYAQVVGAVSALAGPDDYALTAAGGFPGELNNGWRSRGIATFDCEYGFSCMGYELSGGWGAAMARSALAPDGRTIVFVGDGSYLMMNSDLYSSVLSGHPMIVIVCDNGGYAVIDRLQVNQGGASFNNLLADSRTAGEPVHVDFAAHAAAMGCNAERVATIAELEHAVGRAPAGRPHDGDRHRHRSARLDRGRGVVGGRRPGGERPAVDQRGPGRPRRGQGRRSGWGSSDGRRRAHRGPRLRADRPDARRAAGAADRRGRARRRPRRRADARGHAGRAAARPGARQRRRRARRRRRRRGDLHVDRHPRRADHDRRRGGRGDLLREADLPRPRRRRRRPGRRRGRRRAPPRRVQPALRSGPCLGAAGCGVGRARAAAHGADHQPRSVTATHRLHRALRRAVPRHDDPRPRHGPLRHRERGRRGVRRRRRAHRSGDRRGRRHRHRGRPPPPRRRLPHGDRQQPGVRLRLRPAGRGVRHGRHGRLGEPHRATAACATTPTAPGTRRSRRSSSTATRPATCASGTPSCDAVVTGGPPPVSGADGRIPLVLGLAAGRSLAERRPITIE